MAEGKHKQVESPKNLELHDERITRAEAKLLGRQIKDQAVKVEGVDRGGSRILPIARFIKPS